MIKFKGCPKCQGDLYLATDIYGRYFNCLQCGFTRDLPVLETTLKANAAPVKPVADPVLFDLERQAA